MRGFARRLSILALAMPPTLGCLALDDSPPDTALVKFSIYGWPGARVGLEGVELCEADTTNCTTTDANGEAALQLPVGEIIFTKTKEGLGSYLVPMVNPVEGLVHDSAMASEDLLETLHAQTMTAYPLSGVGRVSADVLPFPEGATLDLFDDTGAPAGIRYYTDRGPVWRLDLSAMTSTGGAGFLDVSSGEYQILVGGSAADCAPRPAWPGRFLPNRLPVREGWISQVTASCSPR